MNNFTSKEIVLLNEARKEVIESSFNGHTSNEVAVQRLEGLAVAAEIVARGTGTIAKPQAEALLKLIDANIEKIKG